MAATPEGAAHLEEAAKQGIETLDVLGTTPDPLRLKHRPVNAKLLLSCDGLVFVRSTRAGLVVGVHKGTGFMVRRIGGGRWSAPLFVKLSYGQVGALAGYEKTSTVLASMTPKLAATLEVGVMPTFGVDVSVQSQESYDADPSKSDRGAWGPSEKKAFGGSSDLLDITYSQGMLMSLGHFEGGVTRVDEARNAECYGPEAGVRDILWGKVEPPPQLALLYERLSKIAGGWAEEEAEEEKL